MRTRPRSSRWLVVALVTLPLACGDYGSLGGHASETGTGGESGSQGTGTEGSTSSESSDLVFFEATECKEDAGFGEVYAGLQCIVWDTTDPEVTKIDLFNLTEGCAIDWQGGASVEPDGTVELRMLNPWCEGGADCGYCFYDFNFGVANVPPSDELALRLLVGVRICDDEGEEPAPLPDPYETSLPRGSEPKGAICRYGPGPMIDDHPGTVFMPCHADSDEPGAPPPCDEGLECAEAYGSPDDLDYPICHPTCEVDEDCPWGGVLSCQDGLCRPADPW